jgi:hypothetical protein
MQATKSDTGQKRSRNTSNKKQIAKQNGRVDRAKSASPTGTQQTNAASHEKAETIMKVNAIIWRQ